MSDDAPPRVRFAPSPTGFLHVGGARTALVNWLFARHAGGVCILRIEDTDRERSTEEMTQGILDGLTWLGLDWDEGPHHQAQGAARHRKEAHALVAKGHAYLCFCAPDQIAARRAAAAAAHRPYRYEGVCRDLPAGEVERRQARGETACVRFRVPPGRTAFTDLVHGETSVDNAEIDDFVLLRTDGSPTYQISCVSDDLAMGVTHVIRGDDHLSNTPKQILLYQALDRSTPRFGHLPLIFGPDRRKLSKRHGAVSVTEYRDRGILPEAMVNFLALLGWSPGDDREVMTRQELIEAFRLEGLSRANAIFDPEKLEWLNGQHLSRTPTTALSPAVEAALRRAGLWDPSLAAERKDWFHALVDLLKTRARTLEELAESARPFLTDEFGYEPEAERKHLAGEDLKERIASLRQALAALPEWRAESLERLVREEAARQGCAAARLIHPVRVALTGRAVSPGLFEVMVQLGRERTLARLSRLEGHLAGRRPSPTRPSSG